MTIEAALPEGYSWRRPVWNDLEAVTELMREAEIAEAGEAEQTVDDMRGAWERQRFDLSRDAWLVMPPDGRLAGYAEVWPRPNHARIDGDACVHPRNDGDAIGRWLLERMKERAAGLAAEAGRWVTLRHYVDHRNEAGRRLLEEAGFEPVQYFWRMVIDLTEQPPEPRWPEGVAVRTYRRGDERAVHDLVQRAFAENYRFVPSPFEEWRGATTERETFDPEQWFVAEVGGQIVGVALCPAYEESGWVRQFAVAREWRGRGVARALLHHAFREFRRRGKPWAGLVVDSYNRTGAKSVYERAGMRVERQHDAYEIEIAGLPG